MRCVAVALTHHPDKGGDVRVFQHVLLPPPAPLTPPPLPPLPPLPPSPPPAASFGDKFSLYNALSEWDSNSTAAAAKYGHVSAWDVSALTEIGRLHNRFVPSRFNEDINGRNTMRCN